MAVLAVLATSGRHEEDHATAHFFGKVISASFRAEANTLHRSFARHLSQRAAASNLNRLSVDDSVIQAILRHSDIALTQRCYIKTVRPRSDGRDATILRNIGGIDEKLLYLG